MVLIIPTTSYKYGVVDTLESESLRRGAASSSLNWLTKGDRIELRRGQGFLGVEVAGNGRATGLKKVTRSTGVELLFGTYGKKLKYYDTTTEDWIENGSDRLGSAVVDSDGYGFEQISMSEYVSPAGNQMFLNSANCSGYYKIMVANPGSALNVYDAAKNFKGLLRINNNRTLLWRRKEDQTGLYGSYIDTQTYTTVTAEAIGVSGSLTYTGILAAISSTRTVFAVTFTDTSETFSDNYDGTLTGSAGGTGTINYVTGAYSVTFAVAAAGSVTATYQWENSNTNGITDFTKSGTRLAGQGFIFRQDEGGGVFQYPALYNQVFYCFHLQKTWALDITATDTEATNLPFRELVGIPNPRAAVETGDGIYYIDDSNKADVRARLMTYERGGSGQVIPVPVSLNLDLSDYRFDQAAGIQFGDLILFACATSNSTQTLNDVTVSLNNRVLVYNRLWKSWDILDYSVTCFEIYNGTLVAGDALSNNFITLFSHFDDYDADSIANHWIGLLDDLDYDGMSEVKKLYLRGLIATEQKIKVSVSLDDGPFVEVGGTDVGAEHTYAIEGTGDYVDQGSPVSIGSLVLGAGVLGGGSDGATAYNYERLFSLRVGKCERVKIKFEAMDIGYASVSTQSWWDVRRKGKQVPAKYRG